MWLLICLEIKKLNPVVTESFIGGRLFIQGIYYFAVPKNIRLNSTYYFVMEIRNKKELQQIPFNHSPDIDF